MRRWLALILVMTLVGCSRTESKAPVGDRTYKMVGVVRGVENARGEVSIHHEPIPGLMGRMTMTLPVVDRADLDDLRVGDEVEATLRIRNGRSELVNLSVTRPAVPTSIPEPSSRFGAATPRALEPGAMVPDFEMTTQEGKKQRLSDLRGKIVVLTFVYTRCPLPDFCPLMDRRFRELAARIGAVPGRAEKARLLSVSFDPDHDSPEVLSKHARIQGAKPPLWTFAVGSHEELRKVSGALGLFYYPGKDELSHNLSTSVIGADGRLLKRFSGRDWTPDDLFTEVRRGLTKSER